MGPKQATKALQVFKQTLCDGAAPNIPKVLKLIVKKHPASAKVMKKEVRKHLFSPFLWPEI